MEVVKVHLKIKRERTFVTEQMIILLIRNEPIMPKLVKIMPLYFS